MSDRSVIQYVNSNDHLPNEETLRAEIESQKAIFPGTEWRSLGEARVLIVIGYESVFSSNIIRFSLHSFHLAKAW